MLLSSESLLQLLQQFIKNPIKIKQIHSLLVTNGYLSISNSSTFKWTPTIFYNTLIRAYLNIHLPHTTLLLFTHMISYNIPPNAHTFPSLTKATTATYKTSLHNGKLLYSQALKRGILADPFVQTSFIDLYAHCGCVSCARKVFDEMSEPCVVSCNALLDGFCKSGDMSTAVLFFESMPKRDLYSWTSVVNGYVKNRRYDAAIRVFHQMMTQRCFEDGFVTPNEATFVSVLSACAKTDGVKGLSYSKQIHAYIISIEAPQTAFLATALISLYGKMGCLEYAMKVFQSVFEKKLCTWNAMIGALAANGKETHALEMFEKMQISGWHPNEVTFVTILAACAHRKFLELGLELFYSMLPRFGVVPKMEHYGCVIDLLGRAGLLEEAKEFMRRMPFEADASVLGALLGACKLHGAIELGNEVATQLLELQPQRSGQYILLSSIYAEVQDWEHASSLRKVMVGEGIQKPRAFSVINAM